jgi:hypothetical protein
VIYEEASRSVPWRRARSISKPNDARLTNKGFDRQLATILGGHRSFDAFHNGSERAPVVLKLLRAIVNLDTSALADMFIVTALVGVLKTSPTAHVINKDDLKIGVAGLNIAYQPF